MILVNPYIECCMIISSYGGAAYRVEGNVYECCEKILKAATSVDGNGYLKQSTDIVVEVSHAIGIAIVDQLKALGAKTYQLKYRNKNGENLSYCNYFDEWLEKVDKYLE